MAMKIVQEYIKEKHIYENIKSILLSNTFPYNFYDNVANQFDSQNFFFGHILLQEGKVTSPYFFDIGMPILGRLEFNYIHRMKINCFVKGAEHIVSESHRDMNEPHKVALWSLNTNNGYTLFDNGDRVPSVENQMVYFDGSEKHSTVSQTDSKLRINVNINYV